MNSELTPCLSALDFRILDFGVYFKLEKKIDFETRFFFRVRTRFLQATQAVKIKFELDKKIEFQNRFFFRV